jgi:hypothetical protein
MLTKFLRNHRLTLRATKAHFGILSPRPEVTGAMSASDGYLIDPVTVRHATRADLPAVARLAELDSARAPSGRILVAELDGSVVAAISLDSGEVFADPFVSTADVVEDLRAKAVQVRRADDLETGLRAASLMARVREVRQRRRLRLRTTN